MHHGMTAVAKPGGRDLRVVQILLLGLSGIFLALHYIHLQADFPNFSPWMDWSKYTDEGWYGDAAIRHFQLGHWYVSGDFNPAAALPVLPLLEGLVFAFSGVSLVAARALSVTIFAGILVLCWVLVARSKPRPSRTGAVAASVAVLLLATNPFCFVFSRLAIIEPLLVLLMLASLLAARQVQPPASAGLRVALRQNLAPLLALALLIPLMVLTKTTAMFLLPAVAWQLFASAGYRRDAYLRITAPVAGLSIALWLGYYLFAVRPHFLLDYRYLFSANAYTRISRQNFLSVIHDTIKGGLWVGQTLYPVSLLAVVAALCSYRRLRDEPLIVALILWILGYAAFLAYHNNIQPRYYLVLIVPLTLVTVLVCARLLLPRLKTHGSRLLAVGVLALLFTLIVVPDARLTVHFVRHPEYTLLDASRAVRDYIAFDHRIEPGHSPLVLSISGSELSLMTGLPSIDDDFGTLELPDRIRKYRPGWYLAWNQIDDDKMDAITPYFTPVRVATFPAMDDSDRNVMVLYRLDPPGTSTRHPRRPIPKSLRTKVGQQPSTTQLEH